MNQFNKMTRRECLQAVAALPLAAALIRCTSGDKTDASKSSSPKAKASTSGPAKNLISEDLPMAKNLKYVHDASKADAKVRVKRMNVEGKEQFCKNCNFYTKVGDDFGKCTLFQQGHVASQGWCSSWVLKVAAGK